MLDGVTMNDGWECAITYTANPTSQTIFVEFQGPSSGKRGYHLTQDYIELDGDLLNQPLNVLRGIDDAFGNNEVAFFMDSQDPHKSQVLRGDDALSTIRGGDYERFATDFTILGGGLGGLVINDEEDEWGQNDFLTSYTDQRWILGAPARIIDQSGNIVDQEFDSDWFLTKRTFGDSTIAEWTRNSFKQVTRFRDRLGRVTLYEYDTSGNLTKKKVGILEVGGNDVNQPEYAEYKWDYYTSGVLEGLLKTSYSPLHTNEADMYRTDYEYFDTAPNIGRLKKIKSSADVASGTRPEINYTYDTNGRLNTVTDPASRVVTAVYDSLHRIVEVQHNDSSKSQILYGNTLGEHGRIVKSRDRMGTVTEHEYDDYGRTTKVTAATAFDANIRDGQADDDPITDPWLQDVTTYDYVAGTRLVNFVVSNGRMTSYDYDYRRRVTETTRYPSAGKTLVSKSVYFDNDLFYSEDPYGRKTYNGYRASDGQLIRRIQGTSPSFTLADNAAVLNKTRDLANNAQYIISDAIRDSGGQLTDVVDARGTTTKTEFDSRGRSIRTLAAYNTTIEAKSETDYDKSGNVVEIRGPRYFDSNDPEQGNVKTTIAYNGRELEASSTEAPGTSVSATTSKTYTLDGRVSTSTDARGNDWTTEYHSCCGRFLGRKDPLGHGSFSNTDYAGRVTHTITVADYSTHSSSHNPTDAKTYGESTSLFDALGRNVARTRWLTPRGIIDPNDAPIAGLDGVSQTLGLSSQTIYDSNLADGVGLDNATGITVNKLGGGTYTLSLSTLITQLSQTPTSGGGGITFGSTSAGSASVSINGEEEISVSISDAAGRSVISAQLKPESDPNTGDLITWSCQQHDNLYNKSGFGNLLEPWSIDALGNVSKSRSDGGGRTFETVDAENNLTTAEYDAAGSVKKSRDPNNTGTDSVYDELGRMTSRTDTENDTTSSEYNLAGSVITRTDAKNNDSVTVFDARGRTKSLTDRLSGITLYAYDVGGNLTAITDSEAKVTGYQYDDRNARVKETFPDHTGGNPGDVGYGIMEFAHDAAGRMLRKTDQLGDTVTFVYNLAGSMIQRDYRTKANSPSGTIADSDTFTHDDAGRTLTAVSGRYTNTVANTYDIAGRSKTEALTISGQTYTLSREYNTRGQLSKYTCPDSSTVERSYTDRGQLYQVKYNSNLVDTRTYDAAGRPDTSTYGNGVVTDYDYFNDNMIKDIKTTHPAGVTDKVGDYGYTWDANKNKTSESITGVLSNYGFNTSTPATYDNADRLTGWNRTDGNKDQSWNLSLVGDWTSFTDESVTETRTHNNVHELNTISGGPNAGSLAYDVKGNLTTNSNSHTYAWDFDNRISGADTDSNPGNDVTFEYDALGRRVRKNNGTTNTVYVLAGQQVIHEYSSGTAPASPGETYVYGSYIDEPILKDGTGSTVYYSRNQQYSVTALSNSTGSVVERYAYDAYGNLSIFDAGGTSLASSAFNNTYTYTGRRLDASTGLYYFRARHYSAELGRFIGRDPLGFVDGMSLYRGYFVPGGMDPIGTRNCPLKECCCVENLTIDPPIADNGVAARWVGPTETKHDEVRVGTQWGHEFNIVSELSRSFSLKGGKCRIEWWELADSYSRIYDDYDPVDGKWFGAHHHIYAGETPSKDWPDYQKGDKKFDNNGKLTLTQNDTPQASFNSSRNLKFGIRIFSSTDCNCYNHHLTFEFSQVLEGAGLFFGGQPWPENVGDIPARNWNRWDLVEGLTPELKPNDGQPPYSGGGTDDY